MITENLIVKINTSNDGDLFFNLTSVKKIKCFNLKIFDANNNIVASLVKTINSCELNESFKIKNVQIWQLSRPYLYHYELDLGFEFIKESFGFRTLSTQGKYITLNGTPLFVRGYIRGIEAHDHKNNCNLSEEEFYRKNIRNAKKFGFNLVRFHSTVPSETFFKVADEEGILVHIEMRPPNDEYNNVLEMVESRHDFIDKKFILDTSNKLFNHPSFAIYCLGNEFKNLGGNNLITEIGEMIKKIDPSRLYIDTCAWGENNRPLVDLDVQHMSYYFPFGEHADMYDDTNNLIVGDFNKGKEIVFNVPLIAHEVCHYTALRDFESLKNKFNKYKVNAPWWVDEELKMIHLKGYDKRYPLMYAASKSFQRNCWKIAFEAMRSSKLLGGFMFLQLADTDKYENSNGIIDCFDDINGIKPNEFSIFNGDILLLSKLHKFNYFDSDELNLDIFISRFDEQLLNKGTLEVKLGKQVKVFDDVDISKHDFYKIVTASFKFNKVTKKEKLVLSHKLFANKKLISNNEYNIWVYPSLEKISYNDFVKLKFDNFSLFNNLESALANLKEKKNTVLIYREDLTRLVANKNIKYPIHALQASWNRFKPVIWDRGTNFGGIIDTKYLGKYGYHEKFVDLDFSLISEDCDKINLDEFKTKPLNLISGIDKCNRDRFDAYANLYNLPELLYDRTLRDYSYLFAYNVDGAMLIVCGLNLLGLNDNEPSARYVANLLTKLPSKLKINNLPKISLDELNKLTENWAKNPTKERLMTQFWTLDNAPVETQQYWKEAREFLK